ncbi:MAG TPA: AAA family ATPase [Candidatus Paceibacterota bacterium]
MKSIPSFARDFISRLRARRVKRHELNDREIAVRNQLLAALRPPVRATRVPAAVALVGLTGSGKSVVSRLLAAEIGAVVVSTDDIRVILREHGLGFDAAHGIAEHLTIACLCAGGNVVIDADFADATKRATLAEVLFATEARLVYVRTVCDPHTMFGRGTRAEAEPRYAGAHSTWDGSLQEKSAAVKLCDLWRRTPWHYDHDPEITGGYWHLKRFGFADYTVDTTEEALWQKAVRRIAKKLK